MKNLFFIGIGFALGVCFQYQATLSREQVKMTDTVTWNGVDCFEFKNGMQCSLSPRTKDYPIVKHLESK